MNRRNALSLLVVFLSCPAFANVVGAGTQNFNPITDGLDYVTVHSTKTLKPGLFNLGLFANYAVNSLPYVDTSTQSRTHFNDTLTSTDVSLGVGLLPAWDVGISIPAVISQTFDNQGTYGNFTRNGRTETRLNTKYRFAGDDNGGLAAIGTVNFLATEDDPFAGHGAGPIYNLELALDHAFSNILTGAINLGHRWRSPGTPVSPSFIDPMRNQFIASIGGSYLFENTDTKLIGEIFGAIPAQSQSTNESRNLTSMELIAGVKHDFTNELAAHAGVGTELIQGVSSPDWRVYAGLNYTFGPLWHREERVQRDEVVTTVSTKTEVSEEVAPAPKQEKFKVGVILFDTNSDTLADSHKAVLADLVTNLRTHDFKKLTIEGHTDSVGSVNYNNNLSQRRADAIRAYLVKEERFDANKIVAIGYGPSRPIASNGNFQGRQANRRVEFLIDR